MRAKRIAILASLLVSLGASLSLGSMALEGEAGEGAVFQGGQSSNVVPGPALANDPETHQDVETHSGSLTGYFVSIGAIVSFCVLVTSMVLFRGEVRSEKAANRARRQRIDYHKDLRRYREQLQGPPRDNT